MNKQHSLNCVKALYKLDMIYMVAEKLNYYGCTQVLGLGA